MNTNYTYLFKILKKLKIKHKYHRSLLNNFASSFIFYEKFFNKNNLFTGGGEEIEIKKELFTSDNYQFIVRTLIDKIRENPQREFFKCKPLDIISYFTMENLIENDHDKKDFAKNYLTLYNLDFNETINVDKHDEVDKDSNKMENDSDNNSEDIINNKTMYLPKITIDNSSYYKCTCCDFKAKYKKDFIRHIESIKHINNFRANKYCDMCKKDYINNKTFRMHYKRKHYDYIKS
jgi:hypothetical protein